MAWARISWVASGEMITSMGLPIAYTPMKTRADIASITRVACRNLWMMKPSMEVRQLRCVTQSSPARGAIASGAVLPRARWANTSHGRRRDGPKIPPLVGQSLLGGHDVHRERVLVHTGALHSDAILA